MVTVVRTRQDRSRSASGDLALRTDTGFVAEADLHVGGIKAMVVRDRPSRRGNAAPQPDLLPLRCDQELKRK